MTPALLVASILVVGWNFTLLLVALFVRMSPVQWKSESLRLMNRFQKEIDIEVAPKDLDVSKEAWKRSDLDGTASEEVYARLSGASQSMRLDVPYAEAPVTVETTKGNEEQRRCEVCLN